jgi:hypothetical protein
LKASGGRAAPKIAKNPYRAAETIKIAAIAPAHGAKPPSAPSNRQRFAIGSLEISPVERDALILLHTAQAMREPRIGIERQRRILQGANRALAERLFCSGTKLDFVHFRQRNKGCL